MVIMTTFDGTNTSDLDNYPTKYSISNALIQNGISWATNWSLKALNETTPYRLKVLWRPDVIVSFPHYFPSCCHILTIILFKTGYLLGWLQKLIQSSCFQIEHCFNRMSALSNTCVATGVPISKPSSERPPYSI